MKKYRKYKTGTKWCIWRWTDVDSEYIRRLHVVKTPWFAICLHWILKPDPEPYLHDHPVTFLSIILRGGYSELRQYRTLGKFDKYWRLGIHKRKWFNWLRANRHDRHTICEVKPKTLTLCFMGPKRREWGYHLKDGRWMYWRAYDFLKRQGIQP